MTPRGAALAAALTAGALALAYLLPLRAYGLNVEDEGTLLYQIERVVRGELPYVDFSTGYTPGFFLLSAWLWRLTGDLLVLRTVLACVHALTVAAIAFLIARLARPLLGVVLALLYLAFVPAFRGEFCAFNVPYPAWFATLGWLAMAACMLAFVGDRGRGWLVLAGIAAAVTFAIKPNAGAFAIAGATCVLLSLQERRWRGGSGVAVLWLLLGLGALGGVLLAFGSTVRRGDVLVYVAPLACALGALATRARLRRAFLLGDAVALLSPFVAVSLPWLAFFWSRLGTADFLREVLLVGSGAADLYYVPYPAPEPWALLVATLAVTFAISGWLVHAGRVPPAPLAAALAMAPLAAVAAVAGLGLSPEGFRWSIIWQLESAAFTLTLATNLAGVVWLWRRRHSAAVVRPAAVLLLALFMHLQLYPRADFMHLLMAAPLSLVFAGFLLQRTLTWWQQSFARRGAPRNGRLLTAATVVVIVAAIAVAVSPIAPVWAARSWSRLPFDVAPVGVEPARAGDFRALGAAATLLARRVAPGEPSLGFPAMDGVLFLTGARNPGPHDYFFPGRPDHREEAEIVDRLALQPPRALLALNHQFTFFDEAPAYYFLLRRFVQSRYGLAGREGRYDVLELRTSGASAPGTAVPDVAGAADADPTPAAPAGAFSELRAAANEPGALAAHLAALTRATGLADRLAAATALARFPAADTAGALLAAASGDEVVLRRTALAALLAALERDPARGLEAYVAEHGLDRRGQILLLRTVRDLRDPRAASYLFAAAASGDARLETDALGAMYVTRRETVARQHLWAGPQTPARWPGRDALLAAVRSVLAEPSAPAWATAFAAHLAGILGDAASVPLLTTRLHAALLAAGESPPPAVPRVPSTSASATPTEPSAVLSVPPGSAAADAAASPTVPPAPVDPATTASAAAALAVLAPEGLACPLIALLPSAASPLQELVPTILLELAEGSGPARREARRCLMNAVAHPGPAEEQVVWIAAALGDPAFTGALDNALVADGPAARRAAVWALGELPAAARDDAILRRAAEVDPDAIVRRLARTAIAKRAGEVPCAWPARAVSAPVAPG